MMMPGMDGISALDELKKIDDDLPVLMITAFASVENAIAAMKRGAFDYITKPFKNDEVLGRPAQRARAAAAGRREPRAPAEPPGARQPLRRDHRPQLAHAAGLRPDHPGGAEPDDDPDQRRERHRQGAGGARAPPELDARRTARSSPSTPATCRPTCSSRTCSATSRARSPARSTRRRACSSSPTRARSSSTRSATSRSRRRPSCCA